MKINILLIVLIILLGSYHFYIHNPLEKTFMQSYFEYKYINRPNVECSNLDNESLLWCIAFPSGHAETAGVFFSLLYLYKFIPFWLCLFFIFLFSMQRIITKMHTLTQVFSGALIGAMYAFIYYSKNNKISLYGIITVLMIGLGLTLLSLYKIDEKVHNKIPDWVDKSMYKDINKAQNVPLYMKLGTIYSNTVKQHRTFISWPQLEKFLDKMIDKIKESGINYDAVVGIKTGGAIISDYISLKLGLPNYKIRLSKDKYCNNQSNYMLDDKTDELMICEDIKDNLEGKNIILVDNVVSTGEQIEETYRYLKEQKYTNIIYPTCVILNKKYNGSLHINKILDGTVLFWPWGYYN